MKISLTLIAAMSFSFLNVGLKGEDVVPSKLLTKDTTEVLVIDFKILNSDSIRNTVSSLSSSLNLAEIPKVNQTIDELSAWQRSLTDSGIKQFAILSYLNEDQQPFFVIIVKTEDKNVELEAVAEKLGKLPDFPFSTFLKSRFQLLSRAKKESKNRIDNWTGWIVGNADWKELTPNGETKKSFSNLLNEVSSNPVFGATVPTDSLRMQLDTYVESIDSGASIGWHWQGILAQWKRLLPKSGGSFSVEFGQAPVVKWKSQASDVDLASRNQELNSIVARSQKLFPFLVVLIPDGIKLDEQNTVVLLKFERDFLARSIGLWLIGPK